MTSGTGVFRQMTAGCGSAVQSGPEKVYLYRLATARSLLVASVVDPMTTFDTVVYVRRDTCLGVEVACNDDYVGLQSRAEVPNPTPGNYFIFVDGYSPASFGQFRLTVTTVP